MVLHNIVIFPNSARTRHPFPVTNPQLYNPTPRDSRIALMQIHKFPANPNTWRLLLILPHILSALFRFSAYSCVHVLLQTICIAVFGLLCLSYI